MKTLQIVLSASAVISAAVIIAIGCGGSAGTSSSNTGATGATGSTGTGPAMVAMTGSHTFNPVNVTVPAGSTVQWSNPDVTNHTVTSDTNLTTFGSDSQYPAGLPSGATYTFTVPAGTVSGTVFFYHCRFHGSPGNGTSLGTGMAGSVTVQ